MGCTQSKIENEETVNRCRERKQHMERAVTARNKFAAAHSGYAMSLKNTGAALSDFSQGEVVYPPGGVSSPATLPTPPAAAAAAPPPPPPIPPYEILAPPPLPPMTFEETRPLQRSVTMPEYSMPRPDTTKHSDTIIEEENEEDIEAESSHSLKRRSRSRGGRGGASSSEVMVEEKLQQSHRNDHHQRNMEQQQPPPPPEAGKGMWDYFFPESIPGPTLAPEGNSHEREEMERKMLEEERARKREREREREMQMKSEKKEVMPDVVKPVTELPPQPPPPEVVNVNPPPKVVKRVKHEVPLEGKKKGGKNVNLVQIFVDLDDCFLKASESAHDVSRMLEATRLHYHSNFADKKGMDLV